MSTSMSFNPAINHRSKTAGNSFRLNSEFSFKEKDKQENNTNNDTFRDNEVHSCCLRFNQTTGMPNVKIKVNNSTEGIQKVVDKYASLKISNENLNSLSQVEVEHDAKKEEEINKLNDYIQECISANDELKHSIAVELGVRHEYEDDQRNIANYCNDLKKKFSNIEKTIEDYEQTVSRIKNENIQIKENYDKKIEELEKENKKMLERLEDRLNIVKTQRNKIREVELKIEVELKDTEEQKNYFLEKQMLNKIKYDEMEKKYAALQKKMFEYEMNEDVRRAEIKSSSRKLNSSRVEVDEVGIKIAEYEKKNEELTNTIKDLSSQLNELQVKDFDKTSKTSRSKMSV